ncbi:hypothetical protein LTR70_003224 [Exophiala xenobiotica]|uniref:CN hydrolase domain-containing protein n=1 Tax=Lithohypha guttulata TaxID=1690604 RepID=A0ABR0KGN3_9EURO|nr:hypothetical protein LTR24_002869 [Lithohypha guttulata]KAK5323736.1 hypothetical protein LTR70_003224 [Exophiala xenobiotica]
MPQLLKLAVSQSYTLDSQQATLQAVKQTAQSAAQRGVDILLFPEAYLGGYPRTCSFGAAIGSRTTEGREQFLQYFKNSIDLGDTYIGAGDAWLKKELPVNEETGRRGDGTRETLEDVARSTGLFIVTGVVERAGGSLFCAALYVDPKKGVVGKRRKLMPTGSERLVWSQGTAASLKAVTATIKGVRVVMGCAICWENLMPLLRYSLYSQGVNLWLAPTADPRPTWGALCQTIAMESRCFVMSANQCQKRSQLPDWITGKSKTQEALVSGERKLSGRRKSVATKENNEIALPVSLSKDKSQSQVNGESAVSEEESDDYVSRGGSCIVGPLGEFVREPIWENSDELIIAEVDFEDCARGKLDFDAAGHYSRSDQFHFSAVGLDLAPPP